MVLMMRLCIIPIYMCQSYGSHRQKWFSVVTHILSNIDDDCVVALNPGVYIRFFYLIIENHTSAKNKTIYFYLFYCDEAKKIVSLALILTNRKYRTLYFSIFTYLIFILNSNIGLMPCIRIQIAHTHKCSSCFVVICYNFLVFLLCG